MGNFFGNFSEKLQQFMIGRNGPDKLSRWALGAAVVLTLIGMFIPNVILTMASYALLFYSIYRIFSTNVPARKEENEKFEGFLAKFKGSRTTGSANKQNSQTGSSADAARKTTPAAGNAKVHFTCDSCGQSLSVPKGRGKLKVTCPKCHHQQTIDS